MSIKELMIAGLMLTITAGAANARGGHRYRSNGHRYANLVTPKNDISKFRSFEEHETLYPADAIYSSVWDNSTINPYHNVNLPDSFKITFTNFEPPVDSKVTSEYGARWGKIHTGIDLRLKTGTPVRAAFDGQVRIGHKFSKGGYGWFIVIRHPNGLETLYGHLKRSLVKNNQIVHAGEVIGLGGSTGHSTGPHLHFEVRFLGAPMNPRNIIDFQDMVLKSDDYYVDKHSSYREMNKFNHKYEFAPHRRGYRNRMARRHFINKRATKEAAETEVANATTPTTEATNVANTANAAKAANTAMENSSNTIIHTIRRGDNISTLSRKYHASVKSICEQNGIRRNSVLRLGQQLKITSDTEN